jgi:hypothetical protein
MGELNMKDKIIVIQVLEYRDEDTGITWYDTDMMTEIFNSELIKLVEDNQNQVDAYNDKQLDYANDNR